MIKANRIILGRPIAKFLRPTINKSDIDVGYGPGQLRPDGSRDPMAEARQLSIRSSFLAFYKQGLVNNMSNC